MEHLRATGVGDLPRRLTARRNGPKPIGAMVSQTALDVKGATT